MEKFNFLQPVLFLLVLGLLLGAAIVGATSASATRLHHLPAGTTAPNAASGQPTPIDPGDWNQDWISAAADPNGGIYAAWSDDRDGTDRLRYSFKPMGGTWQPSALLDPSGTGGQYGVELAADGSGDLYAVWADERGSVQQIYFATRPAGGDWSAGVPISTTVQGQGSPSLAVNRRGEVIVGWTLREVGMNQVFASVRSANGVWSAPEQVTAGNIYGTSVAIDDWGRIYVAWGIRDWRDPHPYQGFFTTRPAGGSWETIEPLCVDCSPKIAVDNAGNVHALWRWGGVFAAYRPAGGLWSAPAQVVQESGADVASLSVDSAGNAVALWFNWVTNEVHRSIHYVGRGWSEKELVYTVPTGLVAASRGRRSVSTGPQAPQSVSFPPSFVNLPTGSMIFPPVQSSGGYDNVASLELSPPGQSGGCGSTVTTQTNVKALQNAGPAALTGSGGACTNGPQPPAGNVDGGFIGPPGPPSGAQIGGWTIQAKEIEPGVVVYVVDTPGVDGVYTNLEDAQKFAGSYVYIPPAQPLESMPFPNPTDLLPAKPPPPAPAPPQPLQPVPPEPQPPAPPAPELGNGSPPVTPWDLKRWDAEWVLSKIEAGGTLDARDWEILHQGESQFVAPAREIIALWQRAQRLPERYRPINMVVLTYMSQEGFAEYKNQVRELEDQLGLRPARPPRPARPQRPHHPKPVKPPVQRPTRPRPRPRPGHGGLYSYYSNSNLKWLVGLATGKKKATDPVLPASGAFLHTETPLRIRGRGLDYEFRLTYSSQLIYDGPVGWGWTHNYDRRIVPAGGGSLGRVEGNGSLELFSFDGTTFTPMSGRFVAVVSDTTAITLTARDGMVETYYPLNDATAPGALKSIADRNGNALTFAYDSQGRLTTVTDTLGRAIAYAYDTNSRLSTVTDFAGHAVTLAYDTNGDLISITTPAVTGTPHGNDFPQGKTTRFAYTSGSADQRLNHNLTTVISPNEVADGTLTPRVVNTYGTEGLSFDRVVSQSWGGGRVNASGIPAGGEVTLVYTTTIAPDDPPGAASKTIITDRGGNVITLWHDGAGHRLRSRQVVGGQPRVTDYTYNADGLISRVTSPAGNRTEYTYDEGATDPLARGNLLSVRRVADATRGCDGLGSTPCPDLVTTFAYEPNFQLLRSITDTAGAVTTYSYDAQGNLVRLDFPDVTVGPAAPQSASWTWTYNTHGQPLTFTDGEGNVTAYAYYNSGPATGYRQSVTRDSGGKNLTTTYEYDAVGNVTAIVDPRGVRSEYMVNALGQVVKATRAAAVSATGSHVLRFTHHENVKREDVKREGVALTALDYEKLYWYDANDNLTRVDTENIAPDLDTDQHLAGTYSRDSANPWFTTTYAYDLLDNVITRSVEISTTAQAVTTYRYDALERPATRTDPSGNRTAYAYDEQGQLTALTSGVGTTEAVTLTFAYDANGNLVHATDGEGHPTDAFYDGFDRQVGQVDALGNIVRWTYDGNGNLTETQTLDGQDGRNSGWALNAAHAVLLSQAEFSHDERGRNYRTRHRFFTADVSSETITPLTTDGNGDGWVETTRTFDRNGNLTALTDDRGHTTTYAYDGLDRLDQQTDALGNITTHTYDGNGNLVQTVATDHQPDALASDQVFTTTYAYDALNRQTTITDNLGHTDRSAYDSRGNRVFEEDALGNTTLHTYDGLGLLTSTTRHLRAGGQGSGAVTGQAVTRRAYDGNGNLTRFTDPNGHVTVYDYDALNRLTRITYADGTKAEYAYDRAGNRVQETDPNGNIIVHTYDALNRRVQTQVTPVSQAVGTTVQTFAYDGLSRLTQATDNNDPANSSDDSTIALTYDSQGNTLTEIQDGKTVTGTYDGLGNRLTLAYPGGITLSMTYDALNRLQTLSDGSGQLAAYDYIGPWRTLRRTDANGTYAAHDYDGARRLTGLSYRRQSDNGLLSSYSVALDAEGHVLTETAQPGNVQTTYTYDSLYRLTGYQRPGLTQTFTYDAAGNRTQETRNGQTIAYTVDVMNRYTSIGSMPQGYDANGNLTWDGAYGYHYDAFNRLVSTGAALWKLYLPLLTRGGGGPLGYAQTAAFAPASSPTGGSQHTYDALNRRVRLTAGTTAVRYLYDGDRAIEERDGSDALVASYVSRLLMERGGARSFYQPDTQGNVRALADASGSVVEGVDYEAFGGPIFGGSASASALGNPYLWRGMRYDADDGFYVLGGRRYDPARGRELQR
jgi:YD repeat-containing protein